MVVNERKIYAALDSSTTEKKIVKRVNEHEDDLHHIQKQIGGLIATNKTLEKKVKDLENRLRNRG